MHYTSLNMWHGRKSNIFKQRNTGKKSLIKHFSYMVVVVSVFLGYSLVPDNRTIYDYPRLMHLAFGAQFLQGTLRAMISSTTLENFNPYRRSNISMWLLMVVNAASIYMSGKPLINEYFMIFTVFAVSWGAVMHQIYYTIEDFKRILNIELFKIKPKVK